MCKAEGTKMNFYNGLLREIFFSPRGTWMCKIRKKKKIKCYTLGLNGLKALYDRVIILLPQ